MQMNNPQLSKVTTKQSGAEFSDHNVPFPRSSGARFCGNDHLIAFGMTRQYMVKVEPSELDQDEIELGSSVDVAKTPRALPALSSKLSLLSNGATSPNYGGMNGMSVFDKVSTEEFSFRARVSRVRFSTQKNRNLSTSSDEQMSSSWAEKRKRSSTSAKGKKLAKALATIYNCTSLLPYSKVLADKYWVPNSPGASDLTLSQLCMHNAKV